MTRAGGATRVLVVDDERALTDLVSGYLVREGMEVRATADGQDALDVVRRWEPDVVVLDVMLPGLDGLEVCRQLRRFSDAYVLMLTARGEEMDRIVGLTVGADDYLVKPFSPRELVARVRALLRRPRAAGDRADEPLRHGDLEVDLRRRSVSLGVAPVTLTNLEFELLVQLMREPGIVHTRQQLLDRVWGIDFFGDDHVVEVHLGNLRRKLGDDVADPRFIETVRGVGYRFRQDG